MMDDSIRLFDDIGRRLAAENPDVAAGKMMSSRALPSRVLTYKGKSFAFYYQQQNAMVFRVGKTFDADAARIEHHSPLSPFKTRGPMPGWLQVKVEGRDQWEGLAVLALDALQFELELEAAEPKRKQARI